MDLFKGFEDLKMDILKEVGNIGAGNAATALSKLLDKPIDMAVPMVQMLPFEAVADRVGGAENLVLAVFFRVEGDAPGNLFFILSPEAAKKLLHRLAGITMDDGESFSEMGMVGVIGNR